MSVPTRRQVLAGAGAAVALPAAAPPLPRWRGFNLTEKMSAERPAPFREADFDIIAGWGFDFARLPLNYRLWTPAPGRYDEAALREIDQAVVWGQARGIHVCLCLHTAPGYSIDGGALRAERAAGLDLWAPGAAGAPARAALAAQWGLLAARYAGIGDGLSFNLVNEPQMVPGEAYRTAVAPAVEEIRRASPRRLIIADGTQGVDAGRVPVPELIPLGLAQSTRGYRPFDLTHYRVSWVFGADTWPVPSWPMPNVINQYLYGAEKPDLHSPLLLEMDLAGPAALDITVAQVSGAPRLVITADDHVVLDRVFRPGAGAGEWRQSFFRPEFSGYQAIYDRPFAAPLPRGARRLRIEVRDGDWLTFSRLVLWPAGGAEIVVIPGLSSWGLRQQAFRLAPDAGVVPLAGPARYDREALWRDDILPWQAIAARGVGVHVGEWGADRATPHAVTLAWMRDCLANWRRAGWGWALWNLRGAFGPLDSGRADAITEDFQGHRLDRAMLEVLRAG